MFDETQTVTVDQGAFTVQLGAVSALDLSLFDGSTLYLGIKVGSDAEMTPRLAFGSVPYAARAAECASVPKGAIMYFNLAACPTGWIDLTAAQGRTIVGMPNGGTLGGTIGSALTNRENRSHTHTVAIDDHDQRRRRPQPPVDGRGQDLGLERQPDAGHRVRVPGRVDGLPPDEAAVNYYTSAVGNHTHTVAIGTKTSSAATTSDVIPYVQYRVCQKN